MGSGVTTYPVRLLRMRNCTENKRVWNNEAVVTWLALQSSKPLARLLRNTGHYGIAHAFRCRDTNEDYTSRGIGLRCVAKSERGGLDSAPNIGLRDATKA